MNQEHLKHQPYGPPQRVNGPRVQWYGERGIVNAIVTELDKQSGGPDFLNAVRSLLTAIEWFDKGKRTWIADIKDVQFIVEIGLADFGNPDLIILCWIEGEHEPRVIFVEAKITPYELSCGDNSDGMQPGYNSRINGQLSLKYRFATALADSRANQAFVQEGDHLHQQFKNSVLRDTKRRRLGKSEIVGLLNAFGLMGSGLTGFDEERCSYVALTW